MQKAGQVSEGVIDIGGEFHELLRGDDGAEDRGKQRVASLES